MMKTTNKLMRKIIFLFAILFVLTPNAFSQTKSNAAKEDIWQNSRQMILVTTEDWAKVSGVLQRFERKKDEERWQAVGSPVEIVVGRNGLAWGRGLHPTNFAGPQKVEGDGKSPAGIFRLSSAFGFASASEMKALKLPYLQVTGSLECVDDVKSARYNSMVDRAHIINPDWNSSEKMLEIGGQYRLGVVVDHNTSPRTFGKGSCIFVHVWKGGGSGTSGCTAMSAEQIQQFVSWLDSTAHPLLVQLPEPEFKRLQNDWKLPAPRISADQ